MKAESKTRQDSPWQYNLTLFPFQKGLGWAHCAIQREDNMGGKHPTSPNNMTSCLNKVNFTYSLAARSRHKPGKLWMRVVHMEAFWFKGEHWHFTLGHWGQMLLLTMTPTSIAPTVHFPYKRLLGTKVFSETSWLSKWCLSPLCCICKCCLVSPMSLFRC